MADQRVSSIVRVVDATTLTQGQAVDSDGAASVDVAKINGVTVLMGNGSTGTGSQRVTIADDNSPLAVKTDQTTHGTTDLVAADIIKVNGNTALAGNGVTGTGSLRVTIASDNTPFAIKTDQTSHGTTDLVAADITQVLGSAVEVAATGIIKVGLTDGSGAEVNLGQATMSASLPVVLASDQSALAVSVGLPTNPAWDITNLTSPVNLAAGASGNADSADIPSKYLRQLVVSGSVDFKVLLSTNDNGSLTSKVVLFGGPRNPVVYNPPHQKFLQAPAAGAGTQGFRAAITNLDTSETADFYVSFAYADD